MNASDMAHLLCLSLVFLLTITTVVTDFGSFSPPQFTGFFNTDTSEESSTPPSTSPSTSPSSSDSVQFTNQKAEEFTGFMLPDFMISVNETQVIENLTRAEADMASLKSQNAAIVSSAGPSDAELASMTTNVQGFLSEMTSLEATINDFEQSILEFESSRTASQTEASGTLSSGSSGLSEQDLTVLTHLEATLDDISVQVQTLESKKQDISNKLDEMSVAVEAVPQPQMSDEEAQALQTRLGHLETQLNSQSSDFIAIMADIQQQCSKIDQHAQLFPTKSNGDSVAEEDYLPLVSASQSSVSDGNAAYRAIDDKPDWYWQTWGSCSVTNIGQQEEAWWMVELSAINLVTTVEITVEGNANISPLQVDGFLEIKTDGTQSGVNTCFKLVDNYITGGSTIKRSCDPPILAKYIKLTRTALYTFLSLCEFKAVGYINYSPYSGMDITQSSTDSQESRVSLSSDGIITTCSMTTHDPIDSSPWWQIDMKRERTVEAIVITNRGDNYYTYLMGLNIQVYSSVPSACGNAVPSWCAYYGGMAGRYQEVTIPCEQPVKGRIIRVTRPNVPSQTLSICEVELKLLD